MRYRCICLVIHAPMDLRLDEQETGEIGPGQLLAQARIGFVGTPTQRAQQRNERLQRERSPPTIPTISP